MTRYQEMDVPAEPWTRLVWSWSRNGSALGSPTGAARMARGLQKVQTGTSNVKSCINEEHGFGVYFWISLYCFFPTTALGRVLGPLPSLLQQGSEAGWMPRAGAFSSASGSLKLPRAAKLPLLPKRKTGQGCPRQHKTWGLLPSQPWGGSSHRTPPPGCAAPQTGNREAAADRNQPVN